MRSPLMFITLATLLLPQSAHACWEAPTPACFEAKATKMALAYHAEGPALARLHDLINWEVLPSDPASARALLDGLTYEDLVAYHAADDPVASNDDSFERGLLRLMGLVDPNIVEPVPGDDLLAIYALALQSDDTALAARWYGHLPPYLAATSGLPAPDGSASAAADPYADAQARTIDALTHLRNGDLPAALGIAATQTGESGFLTWRALARHAIDSGDMTLLTRAVAGMQTSLTPPEDVPFDEEAFALALDAAEKEFARTGDPDALVHVYEMFDAHVAALPTGAALTVALARHYLMRETGQVGEDGFDAALADMARALSTGEDEDDATPMLNARTALRLGLTDEADALIGMVFDTYPGVPELFLHDLPDRPSAWANAWLDRMIARFDAVAADPAQFETRLYWSLWPDQDALSAAIDITRRLALYDRRDEAHDFATRAQRHLAQVTQGMVLPDGLTQAQVFEAETAPLLEPASLVIARMQAMGYDRSRMAYALAQAGQYLQAILLLREETGDRALGHWMNEVPRVPGPMRRDYIRALTALLKDEITRLQAGDHPILLQELRIEAAAFHARLGDIPAARAQYDQLEDATADHGTIPTIHARLKALRGIARVLSPAEAPVTYPYEDFSL